MTTFKALLPKLVTALFAISAASALGVTPAQAEQYLFSTSFGPPALGLAVNQSTEHVYAANAGAGTVEAFEASGAPDATTPQLLNAAGAEPFAFSFPFGVAVDNSSTSAAKGDVYVANYGAGAVDQFNPAGDATAIEITEASIPLADQGNGTFSPTGVAVGSTGDVYVGDNSNSVIDEFASTGTFVAQFGTGEIANIQLIATGPGNDVYVGAEQGIVEFTATGACVNACTPVVASAHTGMALDADGDLFVGEGGQVSEYGPSGTLLQAFGGATTQPPFSGLSSAFGLAVDDKTHGVYVADAGAVDLFLIPLTKTEPASAVGETSTPGEAAATLNGSVDPEGETFTECKFEYGTEESYGHEASCEQVPTGSTFVPVSAKISHLSPRTTYHYRLLTNGPRGIAHGFDQAFYTFARPAIAAASTPFTNVGSASATLHAQLDPGGVPTEYHFEYATEAEYAATKAYSAATPAASAGAGIETVGVLATIEGLQPETTYDFRLVASNAHGTVPGPDSTFSTFPTGLLGLPDNRGYEIVSPLSNGDATVLLPRPEAAVQAAADGSAVTYTGTSSPIGGNGDTPVEFGEKRHGHNLYLAQRSATGGWTATDIQPSATGTEAAGFPTYQGFSSDLSIGVLSSPQALTEGAPNGQGQQGLYTRDDADGGYNLLGENASYAGSTSDGSHILFKSADGLDDSVGGQLYPVSVLPQAEGGSIVKDATFGSPAGDLERVISADGSQIFWTDLEEGPELEHIFVRENAASASPTTVPISEGEAQFRGAAADGRYVFYTEDEALYQFDVETSEHRLLTPPAHGATGTGDLSAATGTGSFEAGSNIITDVSISKGAFAVGQEIESTPTGIFGFSGVKITAIPSSSEIEVSAPANGTETTKLVAASNEITSLDTATGHFIPGEHIFGAGIPGGTTIIEATTNVLKLSNRATVAGAGIPLASGSSSGVAGVLGVSEDGSYVYFAAAGALASGASPQACNTPSEGEEPAGNRCNVYVAHDGEIKFVAAVTSADGEGRYSEVAGSLFERSGSKYFGDWSPSIGNRTAFVAGGGHRLVFESIENLTRFDSKDGREIYAYDYETGRTSCISCNPSGASTINKPTGNQLNAHAELPVSTNPTYATRDVSADGDRVFFMSNEALVPQLTNEQEPLTPETKQGLANVYEWEREGAEGGSCPSKTPARVSGGCIFLLSDGTSSEISFFLDASESGNDVFIASRADLVPQDKGEVIEVYDARVGATPPPAEPECTGTGCQGIPAAPPIFATPSSVTFNGIGNFPAPAAKPATGSLSVTGHSVKQRTLTVTVSVPAAGKLTIAGKGLKGVSKTATGHETLKLTLKATKSGKFTTKVTVSFAPKQGSKQSKTLSVKFKG